MHQPPVIEKQPPAAVEAIGRRLGFTYPPEFIAHVSGQFPGLYVEVKESLWPRPKPFDVGPFWSFLYAVHTFTSDPASEPWMRLDVAAETFRKDTGLDAAPVLKVVGDADLYCVDPNGQLVQFNHELGELKPVGLGFWELLNREIGELKSRKVEKKAMKS